jgi:hypothetical protein
MMLDPNVTELQAERRLPGKRERERLSAIEGHGKAKEDGSTVHGALTFVSYDERARTYRWQALTADGRHADTEAKVGVDTLEWGLQIPPLGQMRYTIKHNEKGEWFEVREMTQHDQTWRKFFEMTLERQK